MDRRSRHLYEQAHADAIHDCYLALRQGAEERGGTVWWRGDWACPRTYRDGERLCTVRPDAEGGYGDATGWLSFYLELDRGTTSHRKVDRKLEHYYAYRATTTVTVLLVTLGSGRCREVLHRVEALAVERGTAPLDVRATTLDELRTHGPWASIWRTLDGTCGPLALAPVAEDPGVLGALSRTHAGKDR
jgi:Replication-relaxation